MPIVVEGVSMKEFVYRKYVDAVLNIVEDDPDLELIENSSDKLVLLNSDGNTESFSLESFENQKYLIELTSKNN
jgi:uncharacterized protein with GYD domain